MIIFLVWIVVILVLSGWVVTNNGVMPCNVSAESSKITYYLENNSGSINVPLADILCKLLGSVSRI